jgi:hypothetical protein
MQIEDRVFIVTGASSGIGRATAIALSDHGAKVALLARSSDALQELALRLPGSLPVTVDMTQFDRVREAISAVHRHFGRIDGLVNNAGRSYAATVEEIDPVLFRRNFPSQRIGADCCDTGCDSVDAGARRRKYRQYQFGDCVHDDSAVQAFTRLRSVRLLDSASRHEPSWTRIALSSVKSTRLSPRRTSARTGWGIRPRRTVVRLRRRRQARIRGRPDTPGESRKGRLNISRMTGFAKWREPRPEIPLWRNGRIVEGWKLF